MKLFSDLNNWDKKKWAKVVNSNDFLVPLHEHYNSENKVYDSAILKIGGVIYGSITWNWDSNDCTVEVEMKYLPNVYKALESIASDLGGRFYIRKNEVFDARKHLPAPAVEIDRSQQYFDNYELDNLRWLGFREENHDVILKALKLKKSNSGLLIELLKRDESDEFVMTPTYRGWTYIIGNSLPCLLIIGDENSTQEALTNLCKSIRKLSEQFREIQFYEHEKKTNITGYFKANSGKLIYGFWKSESEEFVKGRLPKELKKIHPTTAHEVASIWSIDSLDFSYIEKFGKEESTVVVL